MKAKTPGGLLTETGIPHSVPDYGLLMYIIKQASSSEYSDIIRIYNQAVIAGSQTADDNIVSLEERLPWLEIHDGSHYIVFVAHYEGDVIGYLALSPYRYGRSAFQETAEISYYLDAEYQGQGIGTELVNYAVNQCSSLNIKTLVAIMLSCNTASERILKKFNFQKWGVMPNIAKVGSGYVDHLYYGKHLV